MTPDTAGSAGQDRIPTTAAVCGPCSVGDHQGCRGCECAYCADLRGTATAAQQEQIDRLITHLRLGCECPYADEVADLIATLAPREGGASDARSVVRAQHVMLAVVRLVRRVGTMTDSAARRPPDPGMSECCGATEVSGHKPWCITVVGYWRWLLLGWRRKP